MLMEVSALTFLSCRNNGLVTIYEVSPSNEGLIQLVQPPHMLSSSESLYERHAGQRFLADEIGMGIVRLSERGSVTYRSIKPASIGAERHLMVQRSKDMVELDASTPKTQETRPTLGDINYTESDFREKYNGGCPLGFTFFGVESLSLFLSAVQSLFPGETRRRGAHLGIIRANARFLPILHAKQRIADRTRADNVSTA